MLTVCTSKKGGGLGIRRLKILNKSLLGKWKWRLAVDPWKNLTKLKYGLEEGGWFSAKPKVSFGVSLWKDIRREAQQQKQDCKLILGNGDRIRFWEDKWCEENQCFQRRKRKVRRFHVCEARRKPRGVEA